MLRALTRFLRRGLVDPAQLVLPFGFARRIGGGEEGVAQAGGAPPAEEVAPWARRRRQPARETDEAVVARLAARHGEFNQACFGGTLRPIAIRVSRRLRSRLGYYRLGTKTEAPIIVISRRHLRRHGWREVEQTLLHEMVHQWQQESGMPVDHSARFRVKARAVGAVPRARRPVGGDLDWLAAGVAEERDQVFR